MSSRACNKRSYDVQEKHDVRDTETAEKKKRSWCIRDGDGGVYTMLRTLGSGTYGSVFSATNPDGDACAVKQQALDDEQGMSAILLRETNALRELQWHPNIVQLRTSFLFDKSYYIVFDMARTDLNAYLSTDMSVARIKSCMAQLLHGLKACHEIGVCHRDLKPSNILVDQAGMIRIADFGSCRQVMMDNRRTYTHLFGTLWWRPPEILLGMATCHTSGDMWSVGCILWQLVAGKPLFVNHSEWGQMMAIFQVMGWPSPKRWPTLLSNPDAMDAVHSMPRFRPKLLRHAKLDVAGTDLLYQLLRLAPTRRISAADASEHPFLSGITPLALA